MKLLNSPLLAHVLTDLTRLENWCDQRKAAANPPLMVIGPVRAPALPDDQDWTDIVGRLKDAENLCKDTGWDAAFSKISLINLHLEYGRDKCDWSSLAADIRNATDVIVGALWKGKFAQIAPKYNSYIENEELCGTAVKAAFPSASFDLRNAGNCIALDCGTAAVFHLMRAVEWGIRALAADLGVLGTPRKSITIPIEFSEWDKILDQLYPAVEKKVDAMPPGAAKQETQEFYFVALADIRGFKDAFRNHVMHTRKSYDANGADAVLDHVRRFMQVLGTRISE